MALFSLKSDETVDNRQDWRFDVFVLAKGIFAPLRFQPPERPSRMSLPEAPQHPPLMIFYEQGTSPADVVLKYYGSETDIERARRAAQRLFNDGAIRVLLISGVQEILRPDGSA